MSCTAGPLVRLLDVETSHNVGLLAAKLGLFPKETRPDPPSLRTVVWGREFPNPLGEWIMSSLLRLLGRWCSACGDACEVQSASASSMKWA